MFHDIPQSVMDVMTGLELQDARDRGDGTPHLERLRQIPKQTGQFLALLAASSPDGAWIEIGASAGYSALWLSLACRARSATLTTFEILAPKAQMARTNLSRAGVDDVVELVEGDFLAHCDKLADVSFCFLDAEKDVYQRCYEEVVPRMVTGGLLVADNVISHQGDLQPFIDTALRDGRLDALIVPIGMGELVCRRR